MNIQASDIPDDFLERCNKLSTQLSTQELLVTILNNLPDNLRHQLRHASDRWNVDEVIGTGDLVICKGDHDKCDPCIPVPYYSEKTVDEMRELLSSARCIAARKGENVNWETFDASIAALGISNVTPRVYKMPRF